jgi:hypothetical protein
MTANHHHARTEGLVLMVLILTNVNAGRNMRARTVKTVSTYNISIFAQVNITNPTS